MRVLTALVCAALAGLTATRAEAQSSDPPVKAVKVTVLSTMLVGSAREGVGEWGFAAVLEVDGRRWLIDTGARAETVLQNAAELKVDLSDITDVVITHNHDDHTGGLITLRRELAKKNPQALVRAHVAQGIFTSRVDRNGREGNGLTPIRAEYEALGGTFVEFAGPTRLAPGVWMTGPVPRTHPERNWSGSGMLQLPGGPVEDNVPEDSSIVVQTAAGLVLVSGCGHAGIVNTVEFAQKAVKNAPVHAAIGGFHLFAASDETLAWTAGKLKDAHLAYLLGAHCTGIEAVFRLRQALGLARQTAVVGAVGASFTLGKGIDPKALAR
ncbi:MAG TPA: MBL fold metallo-hydrolase [Vicinamibacterales bacterium]|nr:MBL fold metallo-hydrolase [Vicinamibacterales bacterium]